jgi:hypothetical protein
MSGFDNLKRYQKVFPNGLIALFLPKKCQDFESTVDKFLGTFPFQHAPSF